MAETADHDLSGRLARAEELGQAGDLDGALAELEAALADHPEHAHAWFFKASVQRQRGEPRAALDALAECERLEPSRRLSPEFVAIRAGCFNDLGDSDSALETIERAEALAPQLLESAMVQVGRVFALASRRSWNEVVAAAGSVDGTQLPVPEQGVVGFFLGLALSETGGHREAVEVLGDAVGKLVASPFQSSAYVQLAAARARAGDLAGAIDASRLGEAGQAPVHLQRFAFQRAVWHRHLGDAEGALDALATAAVAAENAASDAATRRAILDARLNLLVDADRTEEALAALADASSWCDPDDLASRRARVLLRAKRYAEALAALDAVETSDPSSEGALTIIAVRAEVLAAQGRVDEAVAMLERIALQQPDPWLMRVKQGYVLCEAGRSQEALALQPVFAECAPGPDRRAVLLDLQLKCLFRVVPELADLAAAQSLLATMPDDAWLPVGAAAVGMALFAQGSSLAGPFLDWLFERGTFEPDTPQAALALGLVHSTMSRRDEAEAAFDRACSMEPALDEVPGFVFLMSVQRLLGSDPDVAEATAAKIDSLMGPTALSCFGRGLARAARGEQDAAIKTLRVAAGLARTDAERQVPGLAWNKIAFIELERGQPDAALAAFDRSLELAPEDGRGTIIRMVNRLGRGLVLARRNDLEAALVEVIAAAEASAVLPRRFPIAGTPNWIVGNVLRRLGRDDEALVWLGRAAALQPTDYSVLLDSGIVRTRLGDHGEAIGWFRRAAQVAADDGERWEVHFGAGIALLQLGHGLEALRAARVCAATDARRPRTWELLGQVYRVLGRHRASLASFERGFALGAHGPRAASLALGLSAAYLTLGKLSEALEFLSRDDVAPLYPSEPGLHVNRGTALYRTRGDTRKGIAAAQREWARARELDPSVEVPGREAMSSGRHGWLAFWFDHPGERTRAWAGAVLLSLTGLALVFAVINPELIAQIEVGGVALLSLDSWEARLTPLAVLLCLFLLPTVTRLKIGPLEVEAPTSEPVPVPLAIEEERDSTAAAIQRFADSATRLSAQIQASGQEPDSPENDPSTGPSAPPRRADPPG